MLRTATLLSAFAVIAARAPGTQTGVSPSPAAVAMFRGGPSHSGVYRGGGPTLVGLAWRAPTDGDVISSPTVASGVVYVGSNDGHLYALDLATGMRRWRSD